MHVKTEPKGDTTEEKLKDLSQMLTKRTFCPGEYFEVGELLLINISTSENGAQEYEVWKKFSNTFYRFERLTVSWMDLDRLEYLLLVYNEDKFDFNKLGKYCEGIGILKEMPMKQWEEKKIIIKKILDEY